MDNSPNPTPNTNIHTIVKAQIVFLLSTLTEDNFERNQVEIRSVRLFFHFLALFFSLFSFPSFLPGYSVIDTDSVFLYYYYYLPPNSITIRNSLQWDLSLVVPSYRNNTTS
jgi:hypothetical protein